MRRIADVLAHIVTAAALILFLAAVAGIVQGLMRPIPVIW